MTSLPELLDPERALALAYAPSSTRSSLAALWSFDAMLGRLIATTSEPLIGAIRLAWWSERLDDLAQGRRSHEPVLEALRVHVIPKLLQPSDFAPLIDGWRAVLPPWPAKEASLQSFAQGRGRTWLDLSARLLGVHVPTALMPRVEAWALFDLGIAMPASPFGDQLLRAARGGFGSVKRQWWPPRLRPAGMIVEMAARDAASGVAPKRGSPVRIGRMAWHAMSGRSL